jgi:hypothetical protein
MVQVRQGHKMITLEGTIETILEMFVCKGWCLSDVRVPVVGASAKRYRVTVSSDYTVPLSCS